MLGKIQIFERLGEEKWRQAVGQLLPVQADAGSKTSRVEDSLHSTSVITVI